MEALFAVVYLRGHRVDIAEAPALSYLVSATHLASRRA
jgi:hypothetical protein